MTMSSPKDSSKDTEHLRVRYSELSKLRESLSKDKSHESAVKAIDDRIKEIDQAAVAGQGEMIW